MRRPEFIHFSVLICHKETVLVRFLIFLQLHGSSVVPEPAVDSEDQVIVFSIAENICSGLHLHRIPDFICSFFHRLSRSRARFAFCHDWSRFFAPEREKRNDRPADHSCCRDSRYDDTLSLFYVHRIPEILDRLKAICRIDLHRLEERILLLL